jgi:hypothetical protein
MLSTHTGGPPAVVCVTPHVTVGRLAAVSLHGELAVNVPLVELKVVVPVQFQLTALVYAYAEVL